MPRVPVVEIAPVGDIFQPTASDRSSGIDAVLAGKPPVLEAGAFLAVEHPSTAPYTFDGDDTVIWLSRQGEALPVPWEGEQWAQLAADNQFLSGLEAYLQTARTQRQRHAWVYAYIGFLPRVQPIFRDGVAHIGLQSQERPHFHLTDELPSFEPARWLNPDNEKDRSQLARFLNVAGERSVARHQSVLEEFGEPVVLQQPLNGFTHQRSAYAFSSLAEAYPAILRVQNTLAESWLYHAQELAAADPVEFAGYFFSAVQSAIPNFVVILVGETDRQRLQVESEKPVWVLPFSTIGAPEILTPGGVVLDRRPR